jgi:alpha-L-fucosidase
LVSVIEVELDTAPVADPTWGLDPGVKTTLDAEFANAKRATLKKKRWMEKFGEWKHVKHLSAWQQGGAAIWTVEVAEPGAYQVGLTYSGEGRLVWQVAVEGGERIQNELSASSIYHEQPIGWLRFPAPGRYEVAVSCLAGATDAASLTGVSFEKVH